MSALEKKNSFDALDAIGDVMNQTQFRKLFDENFNDMTETKSVILLMKLYQFLEIMHQERNKFMRVPKELIVKDIRNILSNPEARALFFKNSYKMLNSDMEDFKKLSRENVLNKLISSEQDVLDATV